MAEPVTLLAPFAGRVVPLSDLPDPVFAQGIMGGGIAIDPEEVPLLTAASPCAGSVAKLFPGGHGVAIESAAGPILLHLGLDTVALKGVGLTALVGDGDPIVAIGGQRVELVAAVGGQVQAGEPLLIVYPA